MHPDETRKKSRGKSVGRLQATGPARALPALPLASRPLLPGRYRVPAGQLAGRRSAAICWLHQRRGPLDLRMSLPVIENQFGEFQGRHRLPVESHRLPLGRCTSKSPTESPARLTPMTHSPRMHGGLTDVSSTESCSLATQCFAPFARCSHVSRSAAATASLGGPGAHFALLNHSGRCAAVTKKSKAAYESSGFSVSRW
jgi:hypothetical protein